METRFRFMRRVYIPLGLLIGVLCGADTIHDALDGQATHSEIISNVAYFEMLNVAFFGSTLAQIDSARAAADAHSEINTKLNL